MKWRKYDSSIDTEIDSWGDPTYSQHASYMNRIKRHNEHMQFQSDWYQRHPDEMSLVGNFPVVACVGQRTTAIMVLDYFKDKEGRFLCGINPFIVDPRQSHQGYGTMILHDFLIHAESIIGLKIDAFFAGIDQDNLISIKLFEKFGFIKIGQNQTHQFNYYERKNQHR